MKETGQMKSLLAAASCVLAAVDTSRLVETVVSMAQHECNSLFILVETGDWLVQARLWL
jgi:hypothetical protein